MSAANWGDPNARAIATHLDRRTAPDIAADGTPLVDDDLLILTNAWWEPLTIVIPTSLPGALWTRLIDTHEPHSRESATTHAPGGALRSGESVTVAGRSVVVLRGVRDNPTG